MRLLARVVVFAECLRALDGPCLNMLETGTFYCWQNKKLNCWLFLCLLSKRLNLAARKQNKKGYFGSPYTTFIRRRHIFFETTVLTFITKLLTWFLKSTWISSPTSARMVGPRNPKCSSLAVRFTLVVKLLSVYSTKIAFLYLPPILLSARVKYLAESLQSKKSSVWEIL